MCPADASTRHQIAFIVCRYENLGGKRASIYCGEACESRPFFAHRLHLSILDKRDLRQEESLLGLHMQEKMSGEGRRIQWDLGFHDQLMQ